MTELLAILALLATAAATAALVLGAIEAVRQLSRKLVMVADDGAQLSADGSPESAGSSLSQ